MKKVVYFILISLLAFTSCKKDGSNPVVVDTIPPVPTLSSPTDTSSNIAVPVVLTWKESSGAKSYTLQVSASSSFSNIVFNKNDITTTTQQVPDLNYLAVYYWRVSATNSAGTSDWSKVWSFTTTGEAVLVPQLSLPAN
ncbi:MAG: fibronectin type III domain-containing protein, partial [Ignavibacteria bacterium]|nr:fibronectin type III domain-containing protein [Ignavibacteria bacterium]